MIFQKPLLQNLKDLRQIKQLHNELREAMYDEDIDIPEQLRDYVSSRKLLIRKITERIAEIQRIEVRDAEIGRNEISTNIRSMEASKLVPQTGKDDFIAWRNTSFMRS